MITFILFFLQVFNQKFKYEHILYAIRVMESSDGLNNKPRFEPEFLRKYKNKGIMPILIEKYGAKNAASSFGNYQILLVTANELYKTTDISPEGLSNPYINEMVAMKFVNKWMVQYKGDVKKLFLRYNGSHDYANRAYEIYRIRINDVISN